MIDRWPIVQGRKEIDSKSKAFPGNTVGIKLCTVWCGRCVADRIKTVNKGMQFPVGAGKVVSRLDCRAVAWVLRESGSWWGGRTDVCYLLVANEPSEGAADLGYFGHGFLLCTDTVNVTLPESFIHDAKPHPPPGNTTRLFPAAMCRRGRA